MSNQDLLEHARRFREQNVSREQIELNRQWAESTADDDFIQGGKAFSRLLQRSLKDYWQTKRQESFGDDSRVPDIYGRGKVSNSVDYDIELKSDELNIGLSYEF